jgi:hypothetical protein
MTAARAHRVVVPASAGPGTDFGPPDYSVAFGLPLANADAHDAETWIRAVFDGAPAAFRPVLAAGWRFGLGLRLGPRRSPEHVSGWRIAERRGGLVAVTASSRLLVAMNVVLVDASGVTWLTFVRYRRRAGQLAWGSAAPIHQWTAPYLLTHAGKSLNG